ncbi:MAG TPA: DUF2203 domain-containing protein [Vulgatibacter sp.]|nr:DUF2203 domain-containing protein [Vulgatibacter sp.]
MRYFSIDEADRMVPYLQRTFEEIRARAREVGRLGRLLVERNDFSPPFTPIPEDLPEDHRALRRARDLELEKIRAELDTLGAFGLHVKRGDGLVDFPSKHGGRRVLLCWKFGEKAVSHWHEVHDGFDDRRPVSRPSAFGRTWLN